MQLILNRKERRLRRVMLVWLKLFALATIGFIVPAATQGEGKRTDTFALLNALSGPLKPRRKKVSRVANDREDLWLVLATSYMVLVMVFTAMVAANPRRFKHYAIPVLIAKGNSGTGFFLMYMKTGKTPYLLASFSDLAPFVTIMSAYMKAI